MRPARRQSRPKAQLVHGDVNATADVQRYRPLMHSLQHHGAMSAGIDQRNRHEPSKYLTVTTSNKCSRGVEQHGNTESDETNNRDQTGFYPTNAAPAGQQRQNDDGQGKSQGDSAHIHQPHWNRHVVHDVPPKVVALLRNGVHRC